TAMTVEYGRRKECGEYLRRARKASALARERAARVHSARMKGVFSGEKHPMYGKPCPELAKQRTRERMAAGLYPMASTETRRKVSKALKGRVLTPEWRDKISRSRIGWRDSEETRLKKSRSHLGKKRTQKSIEKLRVAMTGIKRSPETIERMRLANIGKSLSEETKRKISDRWKTHGHPRGMLGKTHSREYREMMTRFNAAKKRYAVMFGVSSRSVTKDMLRIAGIEV